MFSYWAFHSSWQCSLSTQYWLKWCSKRWRLKIKIMTMVIRRAQIHLKLSTEFGVFGNESYNHYWWGCILSYLVRRLWLITQHFNSLSQTSGDKVKQPISNNWGPISRMIHQVGHKVVSFTNGLQITDIWNSTKQVTHKNHTSRAI